jgi:urease accessory protein
MTLYTEPISATQNSQPVSLTYEQRLRCRLFLQLTPARAAHIILPRGMRLHHGLHIKAEDGAVLRIESAEENISVVEAEGLTLARACYHLGNRHIPASIKAGSVSYQRDPVIDDMMKGLGFDIIHRQQPFEPEPGAYAAHHHGTGRSH